MKNIFKSIIISLLVYFILSVFLHDVVFNNSRDAVVNLPASEIYTKEELNSAAHLMKEKFRSFPAELERLWYDEEKAAIETEYWKEVYSVDDVLILYSDFRVKDNRRALGSGFEPGMEYKNWMWVFVRNDSGRWKLKTYGY